MSKILDDMIFMDEIQTEIESILNTLPPNESFVLRQRFGFDGRPQTLREIAKVIGVTPGRIRQIEQTGLSHIRGWHCRKGKPLRSLGDEYFYGGN